MDLLILLSGVGLSALGALISVSGAILTSRHYKRCNEVHETINKILKNNLKE